MATTSPAAAATVTALRPLLILMPESSHDVGGAPGCGASRNLSRSGDTDTRRRSGRSRVRPPFASRPPVVPSASRRAGRRSGAGCLRLVGAREDVLGLEAGEDPGGDAVEVGD